MIFTKMQLNGNDFIYVNCLEAKLETAVDVACKICNRKFGIGADGLILVMLSNKADYKMEIYNFDGSKAKICGNALLLLGKYLYEFEGLKDRVKDKLTNITVETDSGIKNLSLYIKYNEVEYVTVNMGKINFNISDNLIKKTISIKNNDYDIDYLCIGNLHGVVIVDDIDKIDINKVAKENPQILNIQNGYNIDFIQIVDIHTIKIKIFERGVGETLSCGSGACASVGMAIKKELCKENEDIKVISVGGEHRVKCLLNGDIIITAKPELVYNGHLRVDLF